MPESSVAKDTSPVHDVKKTRPLPKKKDLQFPEPLAADLAKEWSSPSDWFHQHLYVE